MNYFLCSSLFKVFFGHIFLDYILNCCIYYMYARTGVDDIDIDMGLQKVTVTGWADQKKVLKTVRKTGRRAEL